MGCFRKKSSKKSNELICKSKNLFYRNDKKGVKGAYKKLKQSGGSTVPIRGRYGYRRNWPNSLGRGVDRYYL